MKNNKAQSLIETIVSIGILVTAIVAILSIGLTDISLGQQTGERVQAIMLAREGIELVDSIRSGNWLDPTNSWPYGLENGSYSIDFQSNSLTTASFSGSTDVSDCSNCYLCQDDTNEYFYQCAESSAIFQRLITIENGNDLGGNCANNCEKHVTSQVYWKDRGKDHTLMLEVYFTDWRESN